MDDLIGQIADNTANRENTQRRALLVHTSSEEHSAETNYGSANLHFATDHLLIQMTEFKFKLIFNDGIMSGGEWTDAEKGIDMYPTLLSWLQRWPVGSQIDVDGQYGCQCYDYMAAFWWAQVNRALLTGPNHSAYEIWTVNKEANAGTEFELIEKWEDLQPGYWVVWMSPTTGHVGMVSRIDEDGVHILSQNYQDTSDQGSPLSEDVIPQNSTYFQFLGAFKFKKWYE